MSEPASLTPCVCVVLPVFNEGAHIARTCAAIREHLPREHRLVLVDDCSTDASWDALKALAAAAPETTRALRLSRNFGKEDAVTAGLDEVSRIFGDCPADAPRCVIVMDADLQHPPTLIPRMLELWLAEGCKIVEARKVRERRGLVHELLTRTYLQLFHRLTGVDLRGATDFKLLDAQVLAAWKRLPEAGPFFRGMVAWLGFRKAVVLFQPPPRTEGCSKWRLRALLRLGISSVINFSALPLQLVTLTGTLFSAFALLLGAQTLYRKIAGSAVDGFTTVILLQLLIGGAIMFSLGIIGIYLGNIHQGLKSRPRYIVEEAAP